MHIAHFMSAWPRRLLVLLVLLASLQVHAFSLGRVQGAALIGQPLAVTIQVQVDAGQSITSACFAADVFHGDTRQSPAGVRAQYEPATSVQGALLRVTSASRVNEPIVTVYVRAGCAEMVSRRYVLLADIVSEQVAAPMPRAAAVPLMNPARSTAPADAATGGRAQQARTTPDAADRQTPGDAAASGASPRKPRAAPAARRAKRPVVKRSAPVRAAPRPTAAAPKAVAPQGGAAAAAAPSPESDSDAGQSRLRLDPLEMLSERVSTLESNSTAAPALLSEREIRDAERLERLEASVNSLLALAEKNEASLRDVRTRMARVQTARFSSTLVYALIGLLLLCLLAIGYLLTRVRQRQEVAHSRWFDGAPEPGRPNAPTAVETPGAQLNSGAANKAGATPASEPAPLESSDRTPLVPTPPMPHDVSVRAGAAAGGPVDVSLVEMSTSTFDRLMQSSGSHSAKRNARDTVPMTVAKVDETAATVAMASRPRINSDELIDIRQRAEFFVSLGQTDQAVQVLEARIAQDGASCPQAYLDLLRLFHSLGLKADFKLLADDFVSLFNAQLPGFTQFDDEGLSLEAYPGVLDRLIAAWNKPNVLEIIEPMVFRDPAGDGAAAFDLAAFLDLLMLHAVAQTVRNSAAGATGARAPLPVAASASQVDIDLTELLASDVAPTMSLPEMDANASASQPPATEIEVDDSRQDNLIDFDLDDAEFGGKADKRP